MMSTWNALAVLALSGILSGPFASGANAQAGGHDPPVDAGAKFGAVDDIPFTSQAFNKQQFSGWGGLAFYCSMSPENESNKALCEWAKQRVRLLAKPSSIAVVVAPSDAVRRSIAKAQSQVPDLLDVELDIESVGDSYPHALAVSVTAGNFYSKAVETRYPAIPEKMPRAGTLSMWHRQFVMAGGSGSEFDATARQTLDTLLMQLTADYAEGR
jgi:hypothetical protein